METKTEASRSRGSSSHGHEAPWSGTAFENDTSSFSAASRATLERICMRRRRGHSQQGTRCTIYDNSTRYYSWLLPGWLAEERRMNSGRVYRYYYDPLGQLYQTQHEVLNAYEDCGVIVLDV